MFLMKINMKAFDETGFCRRRRGYPCFPVHYGYDGYLLQYRDNR